MINHCGKIVRLLPDVQAWCQNGSMLLAMISLLKFMQIVCVFVEENNFTVFGYQRLVNGCKYMIVPILNGVCK
jgi:hypothetical protein